MVLSEKSGYILPRGGLDVKDNGDWERCVRREAMEEGGFTLGPVEYLGTFGDIVWYKGPVTDKTDPTDTKHAARGPAKHFPISEARGHLTQYGSKKYAMLQAFDAATPEYR